MIVVVLGMHKSGTTLVSKLLHHAGINMVEKEQPESYEADAFYERELTFDMNLDLLGISPDHVLHIPRPAQLSMTESQKQQMQVIIDTNDQRHTDWGFKDPRTCLTYSAWEQMLPPHKLVMIYRPIDDIWHRFQYRGKRFWRNWTRAMSLVKRWCDHNQSLLDILKTTECETILLSYTGLTRGDTDYHRLEQFIGRKLIDQRHPPRQHQSTSNIIQLAKWMVARTYPYSYEGILSQLEHHHRQQCEKVG